MRTELFLEVWPIVSSWWIAFDARVARYVALQRLRQATELELLAEAMDAWQLRTLEQQRALARPLGEVSLQWVSEFSPLLLQVGRQMGSLVLPHQREVWWILPSRRSQVWPPALEDERAE